MKKCEEYRKKGNEYFFKKDYNNAIKHYQESLKALYIIQNNLPKEQSEDSFLKSLRQEFIFTLGNLSSCGLKIQDYLWVIDLSDKILTFDQRNMKALYKRCLSHGKLKEFDKCMNDIELGLEIDPENQEFQLEKEKIQREMKKQKIIENMSPVNENESTNPTIEIYESRVISEIKEILKVIHLDEDNEDYFNTLEKLKRSGEYKKNVTRIKEIGKDLYQYGGLELMKDIFGKLGVEIQCLITLQLQWNGIGGWFM
jgi:tetratricopeptide (TPR) repeat protein